MWSVSVQTKEETSSFNLDGLKLDFDWQSEQGRYSGVLRQEMNFNKTMNCNHDAYIHKQSFQIN